MTHSVAVRVPIPAPDGRAAPRPAVSVVFPAFNPGPAIERTVRAARDFVAEQAEPWEVLFVCDGCTDGTPSRLASLVGREPRFRVLSHSPNRGKGFAVRSGLLAARGAVRVFADVDLAYGFDAIARVAEELRRGAAVAVANREHADSAVQVPARCLGYAFRRHLQGRLFGLAARALLPITLRDTQAGLKGMTAAVAERLLPRLTCDGFGFDCELLTACARLGVPVTEVPVCVRYDGAASTTGVRGAVRMLRELWRVRRAWAKAPTPFPVTADIA